MSAEVFVAHEWPSEPEWVATFADLNLAAQFVFDRPVDGRKYEIRPR